MERGGRPQVIAHLEEQQGVEEESRGESWDSRLQNIQPDSERFSADATEKAQMRKRKAEKKKNRKMLDAGQETTVKLSKSEIPPALILAGALPLCSAAGCQPH